ncbi:hypothetical protein AB0C13_19290 [Streptomyces sp. NPDC049099]|uniref:hypothetical protein n=1 Tax=Streptomyces sp. NPDC049099 TaxID=3155768 RepID=UPI00341F8AF7
MHRTTTTAVLLATVAVSALSGCVTVQRPAPPAPPRNTAPSLPTAPRPDGSAEPRVVQAPAQEALEMTGPSRHPTHPVPPAPHRPVAAPPLPPPRPRAAPPAPPRQRTRPEHHRRAHPGTPGPAHPVPAAPDVCALGRKYGGWRTDSPESVICDRTYGH